jgi:uncharacterized repeat protein (TIGR01451 family)
VVTASTTTPEDNLANNTDQAKILIDDPVTRLEAEKTAASGNGANGEIVAGESFSFTITVRVAPQPISTNPYQAPADALDVQFVDNLPTGFSASSVTTTQGSCVIGTSGSSINCSLGRLGGPLSVVNQVAAITIQGQVSTATAPGTVTNTAHLSTATDLPPGEYPPEPSVDVKVEHHTDLHQLKTANTVACPSDPSRDCFLAGGQASWTLTTVNQGPSDALEAYVTDDLNPGLEFDAAASDSRCQVTSGTPATGQTIRCVVADPTAVPATILAAGQSVSLVIAANIPSYALVQDQAPTPGNNLTQTANSATVHLPPPAIDPNIPNNTTSPPVVVPIEDQADEQLVGSISATQVVAGSTVVYTFTGLNAGPAAVKDPVTVITFPPGFTLIDLTVPADLITCAQAAAGVPVVYTVTCRTIAAGPRGAIAEPGIPATGMATLLVPTDEPGGTYTTTAQVATPTAETRYDNNSVTLDLTIQAQADLAVTKTLITDPIHPGQPVVFGLQVTNHGPSIAHDVVLADLLPDFTTVLSATGADGSNPCVAVENEVDTNQSAACRLGDLAVGQTVSGQLTLQLDSAATGTLTNQAIVGADGFDPVIENNQSAVSGPIQPVTSITPPPASASATPTTPAASSPAPVASSPVPSASGSDDTTVYNPDPSQPSSASPTRRATISPPASPSQTAKPAGSGSLANSGLNQQTWLLAVIGVSLLLLGTFGICWSNRRRKRSQR